MRQALPELNRRAELRMVAGPLGILALCLACAAPVAWALGTADIALGFAALAQTLGFFALSLRSERPEPKFLALAWLFGQSLAWVVGTIGYYYLPKPEGFELGTHIELSLFLANLTASGLILGSLMSSPQGRATSSGMSPYALPSVELDQLLRIFGVIGLIYGVLWLSSGALGARWSHFEAGGLRYYLDAVIVVVYFMYFFLGASMRGGFARKDSLIRLAVLAVGMAATGMTGGRAYGVRMILYFVAGMAFSQIPLRRTAAGLARLLPIALVFVFVVGAARGGTNFGDVGLAQRLDLMYEALTGKLEADGELQNYPAFAIFERLAASQGQVVVDDVAEKGGYLGFLHFDRALTIFTPKVLAPDKKSPDDGYERLIELHNFRDEPGSTAPISFMADAFERGGAVWVNACALALGVWLTLAGGMVMRFRDPCLRAALLTHFVIVCLEMYPRSVLGTLSAATYGFARDAAIFFIAALGGRVLWLAAAWIRDKAFAALAARLDSRA